MDNMENVVLENENIEVAEEIVEEITEVAEEIREEENQNKIILEVKNLRKCFPLKNLLPVKS